MSFIGSMKTFDKHFSKIINAFVAQSIISINAKILKNLYDYFHIETHFMR